MDISSKIRVLWKNKLQCEDCIVCLNSCNDEWKKILTWMLCFTFISHCETINELVCHEITNIRATSLLISIDTPGYNNYNQK